MKAIRFERLEDGIYRLCVPFENIYTSVFALTEGEDCILLDSASNDKDVKEVILPALDAAGLEPQMIVCSHMHGDHCGGMKALLSAFPRAKAGLFDKASDFSPFETVYFEDGDMLLGRFKVLNLKGHTDDCLAVLDTATSTLLSCDCLQLRGISRYGTSFCSLSAYKSTLARVSQLNLKRIIASHEYVPCGYTAQGEKEINTYLEECKKAFDCMQDLAKENPMLDSADIAALYNEAYGMPPIYKDTISALKL